MTASALDQHIRALAADGLRIHIWPCAGGFQANAAEPGLNAWTCHTAADPIDALAVVLRQRMARSPDRHITNGERPFDEVRAASCQPPAAASQGDAFEDMLG